MVSAACAARISSSRSSRSVKPPGAVGDVDEADQLALDLERHAQHRAHVPALGEGAVQPLVGRRLVRDEGLARLVERRLAVLPLQLEVELLDQPGRRVAARRLGAHRVGAAVVGGDEAHLAAGELADGAGEAARDVRGVGERREGARDLEEAAQLLVALPALFEELRLLDGNGERGGEAFEREQVGAAVSVRGQARQVEAPDGAPHREERHADGRAEALAPQVRVEVEAPLLAQLGDDDRAASGQRQLGHGALQGAARADRERARALARQRVDAQRLAVLLAQGE